MLDTPHLSYFLVISFLFHLKEVWGTEYFWTNTLLCSFQDCDIY